MPRPSSNQRREPRRLREVEQLPKQPCNLCAVQVIVDYRQVDFLKKFMTERGKILSRHFTNACASHQRQLTRAIKRARVMQLVR